MQCLLHEQTPSGETAWHLLATWKEQLPRFDRLTELGQFLVEGNPDLLGEVSRHGEPAIHAAICNRQNDLIKVMCHVYQGRNQGKLSHFLNQCYSNNLSLHLAIENNLKALPDLVDRALPAALIVQDGHGNTALHRAVEYRHCGPKQVQLIDKIVTKCDHLMRKTRCEFNKAGNSPYAHHIQSKPSNDTKQAGIRNPSQREGTDLDGRQIAPCLGSSDRLEIEAPVALPEKQPGQPGKQTNPHESTPVQTRDVPIDVPPDGDESSPIPARGPSSYAKQVEEYLKCHYLRTRGDMVAAKILYEIRNESGQYTTFPKYKATYLDISDRPTITYREIKRIVKTLDFEDILQLVHIPQLDPLMFTATSTRQTRTSTGRIRQEISDIEKVFKHLLGDVTTIFKVTVEDLRDPPHSDMTIEECLRNRKVEIWNWKKLDMCPDVIFRAAPGLKELHLYWSGRNVVLRGWMEETGLCRLQHLERIIVHVEQVST